MTGSHRRRVVVTGLGCISALGADAPSAWRALTAGNSGIQPTRFEAERRPEMHFSTPAAVVAADPADGLRDFSRKALSSVDRIANLGACATAEALADAGLAVGDPALVQAAIIYANASAGMVTLEKGYQRLFLEGATSLHPLTVPRVMGSATVSHISMLFGVQGLAYAISSACASSAHAISEGMHLIRSGRADVVIVGGSDASLTYGGLRGWASLQAISPSACRPFSAGRDGTVLGEGAATLILESLESAEARGARIHAEVAGSGATSDAAHITKPSAERAAQAVLAAHRDAELAIDAPILLSAHGTGTLLNDQTEAQVFQTIYGDALPGNRVIATKSSHGHMLGATGAMEFLVSILSLQHQIAPPILGYLGPDQACRLPLVLDAQAHRYRAALSTSFAFGGLNCALVARLF
jgi:nodulation protein E